MKYADYGTKGAKLREQADRLTDRASKRRELAAMHERIAESLDRQSANLAADAEQERLRRKGRR